MGEKKYMFDEILELEKNIDGLYIRTVDYFAPVDDTKDGADNYGWKKIFDEINTIAE